MERPNFQLSILGMIGLVACVTLNIWLFRVSALLGIIGLNVSKHLVIAYMCKILGVNRPVAVAAVPNSSPQPRPSS